MNETQTIKNRSTLVIGAESGDRFEMTVAVRKGSSFEAMLIEAESHDHECCGARNSNQLRFLISFGRLRWQVVCDKSNITVGILCTQRN